MNEVFDTERPEALDKACFILSGIDTKGLLKAVDTAVEMVRNEPDGGAIPVPDYVDEKTNGFSSARSNPGVIALVVMGAVKSCAWSFVEN